MAMLPRPTWFNAVVDDYNAALKFAQDTHANDLEWIRKRSRGLVETFDEW